MAYIRNLFAINDEKSFGNILHSWFTNYTANKNFKDRQWLVDALAQGLPSIGNSGAQNIVNDIVDYVDAIATSRAELKQAKDQGMNREEWFYRRLKENTKGMDEQELGRMTQELAASTAKAFIDTHCRVIGGAEDVKTKFDASKNSAEKWNDAKIKNNVISQQKLFQAINVLELAELGNKDIKTEVVKDFPHANTIAKAIENADTSFIASLACALKEAKEKNAITIEIAPVNAENVIKDDKALLENPACATVSTIVTDTINIAKQVAEGKIDPDDAVDKMVDTAVATAEAVTREAFRKGGEKLGRMAGRFVSTYIPFIPAPAAEVIGAKVGGFLGEKVAMPVCKGIKKIGSYVKKGVGAIVDGIKSVGSKIGSVVSSAWSTIKSWF